MAKKALEAQESEKVYENPQGVFKEESLDVDYNVQAPINLHFTMRSKSHEKEAIVKNILDALATICKFQITKVGEPLFLEVKPDGEVE